MDEQLISIEHEILKITLLGFCFRRKAINENGCSWISVIKQGQCFKSKVYQVDFVTTYEECTLSLGSSKFKITCSKCYGFFHSKLFVFDLLLFPI